MDLLLGGVTKVINSMAAILQGWSWTHNLGTDLALVSPYLKKANAFLPVDSTLAVLGLWVSVNLALAAYYWITRAINLIRGAG